MENNTSLWYEILASYNFSLKYVIGWLSWLKHHLYQLQKHHKQCQKLLIGQDDVIQEP